MRRGKPLSNGGFMNGPRSIQEWVHWLEAGAGASIVRRTALVVIVAVLSLLISYKQFHGPTSEVTLAQAVLARQIAEGEGFTTLVKYPQTLAWTRTQGASVETKQPWPELHQPPLYALVLAAALAPWSESTLFDTPPTPPDGFRADYLLLAVNVAFLWLTAWLTYRLGRRWFDRGVGVVAALGVLLSAPVWGHVVAVDGTAISAVLLLALLWAATRLEDAASGERRLWTWSAALGVFGGLLFLSDHTAAVLLIPVGLWIAGRVAGGQRWIALSALVLGFAIVSMPWMCRNVQLTGNPLAFAAHGIALKAGDPTAEPGIWRATIKDTAPTLDLSKLGNKALTQVQKALSQDIWSAGGLVFTAFFVAGLLYHFRSAAVNRLRWLVVLSVGMWVLAWALGDSGEGERRPLAVASPAIILLGAGFCSVLAASNQATARAGRWVMAGVLALQALPLVRDVVEPRRVHFMYPPYWPVLFVGLSAELERQEKKGFGWMTDVPAGAAWYSGRTVWAQPASLRDFHAISLEQPLLALVLTPRTLDRPFYSELARRTGGMDRFGEWADVYVGLFTGRMPSGFPLTLPQKFADNFYVLFDPLAAPAAGK